MPAPTSKTDLLVISITPDFSLSFQLSMWLVAVVAVIVIGVLVWKWRMWGIGVKHYEIDQAEIGTGNGKLRFKPNITDRQVAYSIWVELSTRKIGLPIDLNHDVIGEIYNSWYEFFGVTRELIKSIPVNKLKNESTRQIISLSINVLNVGLRPHLTKWQARFRHWYAAELEKDDNDLIDPQSIQKNFPKYDELKADIEKMNANLMNYRNKLERLVMSE